jgi:GNAT superfamily N-acetyltransferase
VLRTLAAGDSLESLTALLHRAYAPLAAMGLNFTAVDQPVAHTARRIADGHCIVAERDGVVVGSVVVEGAWDAHRMPGARRCPWYLRRDVAHLHQLGVEPSAQGLGIGRALVAACEQWARERGYRAIALDTAAPAAHLRAWYARLGYADVDEVQWEGKTYRTVIMVKPLAQPAPHAGDAEHHAALAQCAKVLA